MLGSRSSRSEERDQVQCLCVFRHPSVVVTSMLKEVGSAPYLEGSAAHRRAGPAGLGGPLPGRAGAATKPGAVAVHPLRGVAAAHGAGSAGGLHGPGARQQHR